MEKEYLSIKEFASAVGVSQQAIYKQLNNKLKSYLKVVEGKKMLNKSAFELFEKQENSTDIQQQLLNMLQTELNEKNKQLAEKDKQIAEMQKLLDHSQYLLGREQEKVLALEQKQEAVVSEPVVVSEPEEQPKKRWWQFFK